MGKYDTIFKKRLKNGFLKIISKKLSISFEEVESKEEPTELSSQTLRSDFVFELQRNGQAEIWHIEEQTEEDKEMFERMLKYFALLYDKYKKPVYQIVIFVGQGSGNKSTMKTEAEVGFFTYRYKIINLSEISYEYFLDSPETLPFAILGKYSSLKSVVKKIGEKSKLFLRRREEFVNLLNDLLILSKKRNIEKDVQILTQTLMPILLDYKETETFKEGKLEGELKGKLEVAKGMLADKFPMEQITKYTGLSLAQIQQLAQANKKK